MEQCPDCAPRGKTRISFPCLFGSRHRIQKLRTYTLADTNQRSVMRTPADTDTLSWTRVRVRTWTRACGRNVKNLVLLSRTSHANCMSHATRTVGQKPGPSSPLPWVPSNTTRTNPKTALSEYHLPVHKFVRRVQIIHLKMCTAGQDATAILHNSTSVRVSSSHNITITASQPKSMNELL